MPKQSKELYYGAITDMTATFVCALVLWQLLSNLSEADLGGTLGDGAL